ncbi:MAG: hypothetical protein JNJ98_19480 [Gemmatimonadetes bacterium]|nr:hypothetical protein [Gemmatimonadota bacterium]
MYSTCIFCNKPLGSNESLEAFPVGERLAFDPARGRLWVVCRQCERWNLTPLEERWEAIEQAERLYSDTRRRVSTDNIGLARLADGTTLVRIGEPQRPEFAAWRYGDQFGRRRTRALLWSGAGVAAAAAVFVGGSAAGVGMAGFTGVLAQLSRRAVLGSPQAIVARLRTVQHGFVEVRRRHLAEAEIRSEADGSFGLRLRFKGGEEVFRGPDAERVAALILPQVNRFGGKKKDVSEAVREIESYGHPAKYLATQGDRSRSLMKVMATAEEKRTRKRQESEFHKYGLFSLPVAQRLALEMALHEESERRALEGELASLTQAWHDAEEIASIADNLFLPSGVDAQLKGLKGSE